MLNFQGVVSPHPNSTRNNYISQLGTLKVTHAPAKALGIRHFHVDEEGAV